MFAKLFTLFVLLATAFAAPSPKASPQLLAYSAGLDYVYPGAAIPSVIAPYSHVAAVSPYAYSGLPAVYVR